VQQQQQQQQQVTQEDRKGYDERHPADSDNTGPLSLAIDVLKGLAAMKSNSSLELGQA